MESSINSIRHISLVDRIVFSWKGNVFRRAITLADVDNDSINELVIGSLEGNLAIFKGTDPKPWRVAHNLGSISCIVAGKLGTYPRNLLVVISSEGICNIYDVEQQSSQDTSTSSTQSTSDNPLNSNTTTTTTTANNQYIEIKNEYVDTNNQQQQSDQKGEESSPNSTNTTITISNTVGNVNEQNDDGNNNNNERIDEVEQQQQQQQQDSDEKDSEEVVLEAFITQRLPPNASSILIADIDDDGQNELVIGTYDHSLFSYSFNIKPLSDSSSGNGSNVIEVSQQQIISDQQSVDTNNTSNINNNNNNSNNSGDEKATLVPKHKWQLPGQIGSLVLAKEYGENVLLIGLQEGTNYIILNKKGVLYKEGRNRSSGTFPETNLQFNLHTNINNNNSNTTPYFTSTEDILSSPISNENLFNSPSFFMDNRRKRTDIITNISTPLRVQNDRLSLSTSNTSLDEDSNSTFSNSSNGGSNNNSTKKSSIVCIATLDGVLKLQRISKGIEWKMEIEEMGSGQLIALQTVNIASDDNPTTSTTIEQPNDNIVACGWDGLTLIIDHERNVASFKFSDRVCAFHSGYYGLSKSNPRSFCFIYVTFFGEIIVYYNITIDDVQPITTLTWQSRDLWQDFEHFSKSLLKSPLSNTASLTSSQLVDENNNYLTKEMDLTESYRYLLSTDFNENFARHYIEQLKERINQQNQS
ncbi:hypothetical protein DLAC_05676 [Tieghemostelium lacteum]|uniref:Uncharacterized protein n=1 Tax=Tieghemostelium lacteum TaxID=361077 RepID=A0A151ZGL0_TIELA|nr:hypothetical protein DLAC_05676 [Tieghemostelium lacteum]|eukprot:KYQ93065.1 hypothetical protein DLAC_05676 [Tieghemostelium lacteum]